ncbi:MAG: hypothetical protein KJ949_00740 [Nanoarchaeota archaeon]|nr:hypothetical protein [Nanoarchaeota archaeon]
MFFAEKEEDKFSEEIKEKIYNLEAKDKEIYYLNKEGKEIDLEVVDFVINSLNMFLKYEKTLNNEQKNLMTEAIGNIPMTFFVLDNLKVNKKIEETIDFLLDIIDAHANLHIDRKILIQETLQKLQKLKEKYKKENET